MILTWIWIHLCPTSPPYPHKTFRRPGCLLNVLCTFNLRAVSRGTRGIWYWVSDCFSLHVCNTGSPCSHNCIKSRNNRPVVFCKKDVLRSFAKFTGKQLCQSFFFNKVAGLQLLLKNRIWRRCFPMNFAKFPRTPFLIEHLRWLLLKIPENAFSYGQCVHNIETR